MKTAEEYSVESQKHIKEAEYLLNSTYSITKDQKVLLSILLKLHSALESSLNAFLNQKIGSRNTFLSKISLLREESKNLNLTETDFEFLTLLRNLIQEHQDSPVEFARKDKFIIADHQFSLHTLSIQNLNEYLQISKKIIAELLMNIKGD